MLQSYRNELIVTSACQIIAHSITLPEIELKAKASVPHWRSIIDFAMKSTAEPVQISAADALASVSRLTDISSQVERYVISFSTWVSWADRYDQFLRLSGRPSLDRLRYSRAYVACWEFWTICHTQVVCSPLSTSSSNLSTVL